MNILVTNDDGISSVALLALVTSMREIGKTHILAPDRNWSFSGHVKTISKPLRISPQRLEDGTTGCATEGSPADCVKLATKGFFETKIDFVVSSINTTANVAQDVTCSGTVTAAMEAAIIGIPAIAYSMDTSHIKVVKPNYEPAARWAKQIVEFSMKQSFAPHSLLSVNIPALPYEEIRGIQITRLGTRIYTII